MSQYGTRLIDGVCVEAMNSPSPEDQSRAKRQQRARELRKESRERRKAEDKDLQQRIALKEKESKELKTWNKTIELKLQILSSWLHQHHCVLTAKQMTSTPSDVKFEAEKDTNTNEDSSRLPAQVDESVISDTNSHKTISNRVGTNDDKIKLEIKCETVDSLFHQCETLATDAANKTTNPVKIKTEIEADEETSSTDLNKLGKVKLEFKNKNVDTWHHAQGSFASDIPKKMTNLSSDVTIKSEEMDTSPVQKERSCIHSDTGTNKLIKEHHCHRGIVKPKKRLQNLSVFKQNQICKNSYKEMDHPTRKQDDKEGLLSSLTDEGLGNTLFFCKTMPGLNINKGMEKQAPESVKSPLISACKNELTLTIQNQEMKRNVTQNSMIHDYFKWIPDANDPLIDDLGNIKQSPWEVSFKDHDSSSS